MQITEEEKITHNILSNNYTAVAQNAKIALAALNDYAEKIRAKYEMGEGDTIDGNGNIRRHDGNDNVGNPAAENGSKGKLVGKS